MIKGHEKLRVPDEAKGRDFIFEVNWNTKDSKTNECKKIRITHPDGGVSVIKREHLMAVLFAIGTEEQQRDLTPKVVNRSRWYETVISVEAKKDIKKGEKLTFPLKITLPTFSEEVIAEAKRDVIKGGLNKLMKS